MLPVSLVCQDFGIPIVMYDQVGCGESTRFRDRKRDETFWTPKLFVAQPKNVISKLGIQQFHLLGHSWGACLAALFAIREQPSGLRKLTICNCSTDLARLAEASLRLRKQMPFEVQEILDRCDCEDDFNREDDFNSEDGMQTMVYAYTLHACRTQPWPKELFNAMVAMQEDNTLYETMGPAHLRWQ
jgi:L-proline amide hydrolase